jgi:hypothetical protein
MTGLIHTLLLLFIVLAIVGLILWGIQSIPGIPAVIKTVIMVIVGVIVLLWVLAQLSGHGLGGLSFR